MTLRYSFDTSAWIGAWYRRLPPDIVRGFWRNLDGLIALDEVGSIDEVQRELERKSDPLVAWVKARAGLIHPMSPSVWTAAQSIVRAHPRLVPKMGRDSADPFVIALAQFHGAIVVTEEEPAKTASEVKMPDVCNALGIKWLSVYGFVRAEGWSF